MNVPAKDYSARSQRNGAYSIPRIILTMFLIVAVGMGMFLLFHNRYNDGILYAERLNQMQDITSSSSAWKTWWVTSGEMCRSCATMWSRQSPRPPNSFGSSWRSRLR